MEESIVRSWGTLVLRGVFAIIFGLLTLAMPHISLFALVMLFGAYALVGGATNIASAVIDRDKQRRWWQVLEGVASIGIAIITMLTPGITALALLVWIAVWALMTGGFQIALALRLRKVIQREWVLALAGVLSIVFGALILWSPSVGALAVVTWIGMYALAFGVMNVIVGFKLRSLRSRSDDFSRPGFQGA